MTTRQRTGLIAALMAGGLFLAVCGLVAVVVLVNRYPNGPGTISLGPAADDLPPVTNEARFQGRTADDWGPKLLDADRFESMEAAEALSHLGADRLRWYARGLQSPYPHVRAVSTGRLSAAELVRYRATFEPLLLKVAESDEEGMLPAAADLSRMKSDRGRAVAEAKARALRDGRQQALAALLARWGR